MFKPSSLGQQDALDGKTSSLSGTLSGGNEWFRFTGEDETSWFFLEGPAASWYKDTDWDECWVNQLVFPINSVQRLRIVWAKSSREKALRTGRDIETVINEGSWLNQTKIFMVFHWRPGKDATDTILEKLSEGDGGDWSEFLDRSIDEGYSEGQVLETIKKYLNRSHSALYGELVDPRFGEVVMIGEGEDDIQADAALELLNGNLSI